MLLQLHLVVVLFGSLLEASFSLVPLSESRRSLLQRTLIATTGTLLVPFAAIASEDEDDNLKIVKVRLESSDDSLGVQVINTQLRGITVVAIERVIRPKNPKLREGMILKGYPSALALVERIQYGPFPLDLEFINLAAGGDAISDLGTTIVTPKDALELAQSTESSSPAEGKGPQYSITTLSKPSDTCAIQSRRLDVLEINYQAAYISSIPGRKVVYDSSSFRGTGQPYQMVLGSGDMIPGVDQGLYDMCPGEVRRLEIPPQLGHGPRSRQTFRIPPDYVGLEWTVELATIDATIRQDNNVQTRDDREGRAPY
jgi:hypothetical protein